MEPPPGNLLELTAVSKKGLQLGQSLCSAANRSFEACSSDAQSIEQLYPRLKFICNELEGQLQLVEFIKDSVSRLNVDLLSYVTSKRREIEHFSEGLNSVFKRLKSTHLPGVFLSRDDTNIGRKKTLYDYVDEKGVEELKQKTHDKIATISKMQKKVDSHVGEMEQTLARFWSSSGTAISLEGSGLDFAREERAAQEQETTAMAEVLISLARHYDQITGLLKEMESMPIENLDQDITILTRDTNEIPHIIDELQESLEMIESITKDVGMRHQLYFAAKDDAERLFSELDQYGKHLFGLNQDVTSIKISFADEKQMADSYIDELSNLVAWYEEFASAYMHLMIEIDRRHQSRARHENMIKEFSVSLERLYEAEQHEREVFFDLHGRYLPEDLCPAIANPPPKVDTLNLSVPSENPPLPIVESSLIADLRQQVTGL